MLKVTNLRKEFDTVVAVDGVSLEVHRGELFGLLGPNGAGKTTTIRTVLNIIKPDRGEISFDGQPFSPATWNIIGYLPEERGLYRKSKIINTILYFAALKGVKSDEAKARAQRWLVRFGLQDRANDKVEELSKGNQQKIQLITSLLHNPQLLILDEPFAGLDPVNQVLLKDVLMELRQQNIAIIFSTHQMEQVEKLCDNICLINKGKPVLEGPLRQIKKNYGTNSVHLEFEGDGGFLRTMPAVKRADVYQNYAEIELIDPARSAELLRSLDGKLQLRKFEVVEPSLHSIFINVVGPSAEREPEPVKSAPEGSKKRMDPKLRRSVVSLGVLVIVAMIVGFSTMQQEDPNWIAPVLVAVGIVVAGYRFMRERKRLALEESSRGKNP
ncbi:MAG TPA: ATP-binding cassette domain-containing protein [Bacteroidota bacterium]